MKEIKIQLKSADNAYPIIIGINLLRNLVGELKRRPIFANKYIIITDSGVRFLYGEKLLRLLKRAGLDSLLLSFKEGEKNKNLETIRFLYDKLLKRKVGRDSVIVSLGGGTAGDISGFVAATLYRGIPYIQVPTTLLSQIDSSIGGKVGMNHALGKNLIGAFWQPKAVYIDIDTLKTLPRREFLNGLAEAIKCAAISDEALFLFLQRNLEKIFKQDAGILEKLISRCCQIKAAVVQKDERESGPRKILNFGHTIGHAIESLAGYRLAHGEAVAIGMVAESKIAEKIGLIERTDTLAIIRLIGKTGLPVKTPANILSGKIIEKTKFDKKNIGGVPKYSLPCGIGKVRYGIKVEEKLIKSVLKEMR
jgi:3-dehydroquinate synthase